MATLANDNGAAMRVNGDISDLFFNTEHDSATIYDHRGQFEDYDRAKLREIAQSVLDSLDRLGVAVPTADDLVADFFNRL